MMNKSDFLKRLGIASAAGSLAFLKGASTAQASTNDPDVLVGLWEMTVTAKDGAYHYVHAISRGSWVATGDIDERYEGFKYSPTLGTYTRESDGSFRYKEKGWVFDTKGTSVGRFQTVGSLRLDSDNNTFRGPGTFTQYDLHGKSAFTETFTLTATRVAA